MKITEVDFKNSEHLAAVKRLVAEYFQYGNKLSMEAADISFNSEEMLRDFDKNAEKYSRDMGGLLLLVEHESEFVGVGAYRRKVSCCGERSAEMKRVFIREPFQGNGWGRELVEYLITHAKRAGYPSMKLESGLYMEKARALYEKLGFSEIDPYSGSECGHQGLDVLYYMELKL